jgi:cell division protein ZapE
MTPLDYYHEQCRLGVVVEDQQQLLALQHFQKLHSNLIHEHQKRKKILSVLRKPRLVHGLYIWGGVGIGKTFLMDCFYHCVPFKGKLRMHFHQFMRFVHHELKLHQGEKDPLQIIARKLAKKYMLLCFDEFFVTDIADAMILARMLRALLAQGLCLVATSNVMPDDLYKKGLQRQLFLPAIEMLKHHTTVVHVPTTVDYRLRHLRNAGVFYTPNDQAAHENMEKTFFVLVNGKSVRHDAVEICGRKIPVVKEADDTIWFDFNVICKVPRSQHDYLEIAKQYRTVFVSNIPVIPPDARDMVTLLIRMVDVFYDAHVRLVISAAEPVDKIYPQGYMLFEYNRACSRLLEMQSELYFSSMPNTI